MIGSIIGAAMSAAGSIFGGMKASQAVNNVKANLKSQQQRNADWYNRRYNEDATQRADAQAMFNRTEEAIRNRNKQAAGAAAVTGATEESVAATKAANAAALADAASSITANASLRKDAIENQYMATDANLSDKLNNMEQQKAQAIAQAVQGVAQVGSSIASNF